MSKKNNPFLAQIEEKYRRDYELKLAVVKADYRKQLNMALQMSSDAALMALDDTYPDVDRETAKRFHELHEQWVDEISQLIIDDSKDDKEIVYSKESIDRRLMQIVGEEGFIPWDERNGGM